MSQRPITQKAMAARHLDPRSGVLEDKFLPAAISGLIHRCSFFERAWGTHPSCGGGNLPPPRRRATEHRAANNAESIPMKIDGVPTRSLSAHPPEGVFSTSSTRPAAPRPALGSRANAGRGRPRHPRHAGARRALIGVTAAYGLAIGLRRRCRRGLDHA